MQLKSVIIIVLAVLFVLAWGFLRIRYKGLHVRAKDWLDKNDKNREITPLNNTTKYVAFGLLLVAAGVLLFAVVFAAMSIIARF